MIKKKREKPTKEQVCGYMSKLSNHKMKPNLYVPVNINLSIYLSRNIYFYVDIKDIMNVRICMGFSMTVKLPSISSRDLEFTVGKS